MTSPRVRRLQSDYERVYKRFYKWPLVELELAQGMPPDTYRIWYRIKGLYAEANGQILERNEHVLEIGLGLEYPRRAPKLKLLTPLFHPNFNRTEVCAQDVYAAAEGLDDLIVRVGRMICYQQYNTKSPLNGIAAKWAAENSHRLPVDDRDIAPPPPDEAADIGFAAAMVEQKRDVSAEVVVNNKLALAKPSTEAPIKLSFNCPGCDTALEGDESDAGTVINCPSCEVVMTVPGVAATPAAEARDWYYMDGNSRVGPIQEDNLISMFKTQKLEQDSLVWTEGLDDWVAAHTLDGLK